MSMDEAAPSTDLIRWTFAVPPEVAEAVENHLNDLGADVFVRDGQTFHVTWEEPDVDLDPVVEAVWSLAGEPFEITQEEFHRLELHVLQHEDEHAEVAEEAEAPSEFHPGFDALEIKDL